MNIQQIIIFLTYCLLLIIYTRFILFKIYTNYACLYYQCSPITGSEPIYQPKKWNDDIYIKYSHNCYAYALNDINLQLKHQCQYKKCKYINPQPGHFCKSKFKMNTCFQLNKKIQCDNPLIKIINFTEKCPSNYYKIGLATNLNAGYHFYRQNTYGLWDHKDGGNKVNKYDASHKIIFNPELANRNYNKNQNYENWCSFYCVPKNEYKKTNMSRLKENQLLY